MTELLGRKWSYAAARKAPPKKKVPARNKASKSGAYTPVTLRAHKRIYQEQKSSPERADATSQCGHASGARLPPTPRLGRSLALPINASHSPHPPETQYAQNAGFFAAPMKPPGAVSGVYWLIGARDSRARFPTPRWEAPGDGHPGSDSSPAGETRRTRRRCAASCRGSLKTFADSARPDCVRVKPRNAARATRTNQGEARAAMGDSRRAISVPWPPPIPGLVGGASAPAPGGCAAMTGRTDPPGQPGRGVPTSLPPGPPEIARSRAISRSPHEGHGVARVGDQEPGCRSYEQSHGAHEKTAGRIWSNTYLQRLDGSGPTRSRGSAVRPGRVGAAGGPRA